MWGSSMLKIMGSAGQVDFPLLLMHQKKVVIVALHVHHRCMHRAETTNACLLLQLVRIYPE
eukprot:2369772-Ditylum_brightwellii.AAC.1